MTHLERRDASLRLMPRNKAELEHTVARMAALRVLVGHTPSHLLACVLLGMLSCLIMQGRKPLRLSRP